MRSRFDLLAGVLATAIAFAKGGAAGAQTAAVAAEIRPPFKAATQAPIDLDKDGKSEFVVIGENGEVRTYVFDKASGQSGEPLGMLTLPSPERSALALADILGTGRVQLAVLSPAGLQVYETAADLSFQEKAISLAPRARFTWRLGAPRFVDFAGDLNADGRPDVVCPGPSVSDIWVNEKGPDGAPPRFKKAASIPIEVDATRSTSSSALSDRLANEIVIPRLDIRDLNGDGRDDLAVEDGQIRSFHLQKDDGTLPPKPDITVNLEIFRDTTPESGLRPGRTLAGLDRTLYVSTELDGDKIPDYIVAHRRKVWVFHGTKAGPQFTEPSNVLKTADDVTTLIPVKLDDDAFTDMVLIKVEIPSVATIMTGFFGEWDIDIQALGYRHGADRKFETTPAYKSTLTVRLPSILEILKNPQAIIARFNDASQGTRLTAEGDLDADREGDVAILSKDAAKLELWRGKPGAKADSEGAGGWIRKVLFDDKNTVWTLDRIIDFVANQSERRINRLTSSRDALAPLVLRDPAKYTRTGLFAADFDGDARSEIVVAYLEISSRSTLYDLIRVK